MDYFVWDDSLKVGEPTIDTQHKELFAAVNALIKTCEEGKGQEELKKSIDFLNNYTIKHFFEEEQIQHKYKYPDLENHHKIHEAFKKQVRDLSVKWIMGGASEALAREVREKIGEWLVVHVKGQDVKLGAHIKSAAKSARP
jgi:hemerythrin